MSRQAQIFVTPTPELRWVIEQRAAKTGHSISAIVREVLLAHFAPEIEALQQCAHKEGEVVHLEQENSATAGVAADAGHV